jgi:SAM-dependent methyltransferase
MDAASAPELSSGHALAAARAPQRPEHLGTEGRDTTRTGCPICFAPDTALLYVKHGFPLHRCAACEAVFVATPPAPEALTALYSAAYFTEGGAGYRDYIADAATHRRQARRYLAVLDRLGIAPGRLLDVGCAAGFFLDEARRHGWTVRGCDLSDYAQLHATRLGVPVDQRDFLDPEFVLPEGSIEVATMFNVLEHVRDPRGAADKLSRLVRGGGHVLLETWDPRSWFARILGSAWPTYAPPTVLHCFTPTTLRHVFPAPLWTLILYRPALKWISLRHGLSLIEHEGHRSVLTRPLAWLRASWIGRIDIPYYLRDLTIAVLRRNART